MKNADDRPPHNSTDAASTEPGKLRLTRPHLLIQRTLDQKEEKDEWGNVRPSAWPGVTIIVSKASRRNALIIMDRLFKALAKIGIEVSVQPADYNKEAGTFAVRGHDQVLISVTEEYTKVPHVATAVELSRAKGSFGKRLPKYDNIPTGKLKLHPGGVADLSSEEALGKLIAKSCDDIVIHLDQVRDQRIAAAAQQKLKWERQAQEQKEQACVNAFHKAVESFQRYREIMDYIDEVRRFGRVPADQRKDGQSFEEWLTWAEWRARQVHPLGQT